MNRVYLITYIKSQFGDYDGLNATLSAYGNNALNYTGDYWLIKTNETAVQLNNKLKTHLVNGEHFLVIEVTRNYYGWLPNSAWVWMNANLT
jgi:hypothetical protein